MALSNPPVGKLLDYEQYIEHQIRRTRSKIKTTDILTAAMILVTAALGVLFLEVLVDHTVGMPAWARRVVLWGGLLGGTVYAALRVVLPMVSRVNGLYAARTIEGTDPTFKNSLITYLELRRHKTPIGRSAMAAVEAKAVKDLTRVEIDSVVNQRRLLQMAYAFSAVIVAFSLYAAFTPKSILDSTRRALMADVVRPTNTRLVGIKPGDATVVSGENVAFSVDVQGTRPAAVKLRYSVDGGKYYSTSDFTPGQNFYDPWQVTIPDVRQSLDYYLTGGDAESLRYRLKVLPAPMVAGVTADYDFPPYTGVPPRRGVEGGNIEAIEGTVVHLHARTNEPAVSAYFDFSKGANAGRIEVDDKDARLLEGTLVVKESGTYTIKFKTTGGQVNPDPVVYDVTAIPDKPPTEVVFLRPETPEVTVPANVRVPLLLTAADDFGVKEALLHVRQGNETLYSVNLLEKKPPTRRFKGGFTVDLAENKVRPGSQLEYWVTVRDTKEPISNRAETARQIIKVGDPVKESERKALDDRLQQDQAEAVKQLPAEQVDPAVAPENPAQEPPAGPQDQTPPEPGVSNPNDNPQPNPANTPDQPNPRDEGVADRNPAQDAPPEPAPAAVPPEQLNRLENALRNQRQREARQQGNPPGGPTPPTQPGANSGATNGNRDSASTPPGGTNAGPRPPANPVNPSSSNSPPAPQPGGSSPAPAGEQVSRAGESGTPPGTSTPPSNPPGSTKPRDGASPPSNTNQSQSPSSADGARSPGGTPPRNSQPPANSNSSAGANPSAGPKPNPDGSRPAGENQAKPSDPAPGTPPQPSADRPNPDGARGPQPAGDDPPKASDRPRAGEHADQEPSKPGDRPNPDGSPPSDGKSPAGPTPAAEPGQSRKPNANGGGKGADPQTKGVQTPPAGETPAATDAPQGDAKGTESSQQTPAGGATPKPPGAGSPSAPKPGDTSKNDSRTGGDRKTGGPTDGDTQPPKGATHGTPSGTDPGVEPNSGDVPKGAHPSDPAGAPKGQDSATKPGTTAAVEARGESASIGW